MIRSGSILRRRLTTAIATIAGATALATGVASVTQAAPAKPAPVTYQAKLVGKTVKLDVTNGTIAIADDHISLRNTAGADLVQFPLRYNLEDRTYPIKAAGNSHSITLTPVRDVAKSTKADPATVAAGRTIVEKRIRGPQTRQERDDQALQRFQSQVSTVVTVGTIIGVAIGAVVGGIIGCVPGLAAAGVGCIPGFLAGASVGSVVGLIAGGGGALIPAAIQYFNTINSPFKPQYY